MMRKSTTIFQPLARISDKCKYGCALSRRAKTSLRRTSGGSAAILAAASGILPDGLLFDFSPAGCRRVRAGIPRSRRKPGEESCALRYWRNGCSVFAALVLLLAVTAGVQAAALDSESLRIEHGKKLAAGKEMRIWHFNSFKEPMQDWPNEVRGGFVELRCEDNPFSEAVLILVRDDFIPRDSATRLLSAGSGNATPIGAPINSCRGILPRLDITRDVPITS